MCGWESAGTNDGNEYEDVMGRICLTTGSGHLHRRRTLMRHENDARMRTQLSHWTSKFRGYMSM